MAIIPVHEEITRRILRQFGFVESAIDLVVTANVDVDEKQQSSYEQTNLHAMLGFVVDNKASSGRRMQTVSEAMVAVESNLKAARINIQNAIDSRNYGVALECMGVALHTVQDRELHHFEPWPYDGLWHGVQSDLIYMAKHGVRDLCLIRYLVAGTGNWSGNQSAIAAEVGFNVPAPTPVSLGIGASYSTDPARRNEWAIMLNFCFGADCPGSGVRRNRNSASPRGPLGAGGANNIGSPVWSYEKRKKPAELVNAEEASFKFVDEIRGAAGESWQYFVKLSRPPN